MKTKILVCVAIMLIIITCFLVACNNDYTNPDYLGGGGTGDIAEKSDETEKDIVDSINKDFDNIANDTDFADATTLEASDTLVEITKSGSYILSGNYTAGVSVSKKELTVHLFLDNANISNANGAALSTKKSTTLTITVIDETTNTVSTTADDENGLHVKGTLTLNGSGKLTVTSASKNAVKVSGAMVVANTQLVATSKKHAIACGSLNASNAKISVTSQKDGINADCDFDNDENKTDYEFTTEQGYVSLQNCDFTADVDGDGIQAETFVYINGGTINITTHAEWVAYSSANMQEYDLEYDDFRYVRSGSSSYKKVASDERTNGTKYAMAQSCKGIKVGEIEYEIEDADGNVTQTITIANGDYALVVESGNITINSDDDAMHVNSGNAFVNGGTITISTLDDGITADKLTRIAGGTITITDCYEGLEGGQVEIFDGTINITAQDDGINAASDDKNIEKHIIISGGTVTVDAEGDGLDSNGSMLFTGGVTIVYGPTRGGNAGLDADNGIVINGGTVFASSTLGMVETPSTNSEQYVVSYAQNSSLQAGSVITLKDDDGNEILSVTLAKSCQSVILSSDKLQKGEKYSVYSNDTQLATFTISSTITQVGTAQSNGGFGGGGFGGGGRPGGR